MRLQAGAVAMRCILHAAIGVMQQAGCGPLPHDGHVERGEGEFLPEVVGHEGHKHTPGVFADHEVDVLPGTKLHEVIGEHAPVKSHHHQGYGRLGDGLREAARADDGTVEAIEDPARRFAVGVLWHPEEGEDAALFQALVAEAKRYREERR